MLKIALDIKEDMKDYIKNELDKRGFDYTDESSFGTIWVFGLSHIDFSNKSIELCQNGSLKFYDVYLEDIKYFEIYSEEMK